MTNELVGQRGKRLTRDELVERYEAMRRIKRDNEAAEKAAEWEAKNNVASYFSSNITKSMRYRKSHRK